MFLINANPCFQQAVKKLGVYGYRKSVSLAFYEFVQEFQDFSQLTWFAWATSGPKLLRVFDSEGPAQEVVLSRSVEVLSTWRNLRQALFNRVTLTDQVGSLLGALHCPLQVLFFRSNHLSLRDLEYLSQSHHVETLRELTMEKMDLHDMGHCIATLARKASHLKTLNLQDLNLREEDQIEIMLALQDTALELETLVLLDNESHLMSDSYELIAELACSLPKLEMFYIFPFNYGPFERDMREFVEALCSGIVSRRGRDDLILAY